MDKQILNAPTNSFVKFKLLDNGIICGVDKKGYCWEIARMSHEYKSHNDDGVDFPEIAELIIRLLNVERGKDENTQINCKGEIILGTECGKCPKCIKAAITDAAQELRRAFDEATAESPAPQEAIITINGVNLTEDQSTTVRVAMSSFFDEMSEPSTFGNNFPTKTRADAYKHHSNEVLRLIAQSLDEKALI